MNCSVEQNIIDEVYKHHNMKMSKECVKSLIEILKKHCPHYKKKQEKTSNCECNPCECNPCKC